MLEDMQLHGFSRSTQQGYVHSIAKLAKYYDKSPDLISEDELRQRFLDRTQKQKVMNESVLDIVLCRGGQSGRGGAKIESRISRRGASRDESRGPVRADCPGRQGSTAVFYHAGGRPVPRPVGRCLRSA